MKTIEGENEMSYQQLEGYVPEEKEQEEESVPNITHGTRLWSIISLIFSIVGIILLLVPAVGLSLGALGVGFAVYSRIKNGYFTTTTVVGIIVGFASVACCAFFLVFNALSEAGFVLTLPELLTR